MKRKNKDGSQTNVACPVAVNNYNCFIGGVDMADAKRKVYSCSRHSKNGGTGSSILLLMCAWSMHLLSRVNQDFQKR